MIKPLSKLFSSQTAKLHMQGISAGLISSLGIGFVTALYEAIAEDENSFGFIAIEDDEVLGFVAFTNNLWRFYKRFIQHLHRAIVRSIDLQLCVWFSTIR